MGGGSAGKARPPVNLPPIAHAPGALRAEPALPYSLAPFVPSSFRLPPSINPAGLGNLDTGGTWPARLDIVPLRFMAAGPPTPNGLLVPAMLAPPALAPRGGRAPVVSATRRAAPPPSLTGTASFPRSGRRCADGLQEPSAPPGWAPACRSLDLCGSGGSEHPQSRRSDNIPGAPWGRSESTAGSSVHDGRCAAVEATRVRAADRQRRGADGVQPACGLLSIPAVWSSCPMHCPPYRILLVLKGGFRLDC